MKKVIEDLEKISNFTPNGWDAIKDSRKKGLEEAFVIVSNHTTIFLELLDFYDSVWTNVNAHSLNIEEEQKANARRVIDATKGMFILCMSSIEFSIKSALRIDPGPLTKPNKKMKLWEVMKTSYLKGLMDKNKWDQWDGAINARNAIIHNNSIWEDEDKHIKYPNGLTLHLQKGKMIQGNLRFLTQLTEWMVSSYCDWCNAIMNQKPTQKE